MSTSEGRVKPGASGDSRSGPQVPQGLFVRCEGCSEIVYGRALRENLEVCPRCDFHMRLGARERIEMLVDEGAYREISADIRSNDPLRFRDRVDYRDRLRKGAEKTGPRRRRHRGARQDRADAGGPCRHGVRVHRRQHGVVVVGEQITRAVEAACDARIPLIVVSCSGGARMQEGALSLMQMAKISSALALLDDAGLPYISLLTHPTTGGVTASYAMLGDMNLAEPGALIGFAGPRVIQQTIRGELPPGFQRSEFLLRHGMLDRVVHRRDLRGVLGGFLRFMYEPAEAAASVEKDAAATVQTAPEPALVRTAR